MTDNVFGGTLNPTLLEDILSILRYCSTWGKTLSSRILEDQFASPCPYPRTSSPCPWTTKSLKIFKDFTFCKLSIMYDNVKSINSVTGVLRHLYLYIFFKGFVHHVQEFLSTTIFLIVYTSPQPLLDVTDLLSFMLVIYSAFQYSRHKLSHISQCHTPKVLLLQWQCNFSYGISSSSI